MDEVKSGFNPRDEPRPIRGELVHMVADYLNRELLKCMDEHSLTCEELHAVLGIVSGRLYAIVATTLACVKNSKNKI